MKGLFIKDLRLLMAQKTSMLVLLGLGLFFTISNGVAFGVNYSVILIVTILMSTITYDENNNGMSYILTLPISKKQYVFEKYLLTMGGALFINVLLSAVGAVKIYVDTGVMDWKEVGISFVVAVVLTILITAYSIPIDLKYEAAKARYMGMSSIFIICVVVLLIARNEKAVMVMQKFVSNISKMSLTVFAIVGIIVLVAMLVISVLISVKIVNKKEY